MNTLLYSFLKQVSPFIVLCGHDSFSTIYFYQMVQKQSIDITTLVSYGNTMDEKVMSLSKPMHCFRLQPQRLLPQILLDVLLTPLLLSSLGTHHYLGIRMESSGATTLVSLRRTQGGNLVVLL